MALQVQLNGQTSIRNYIGWTPQVCSIKLSTPQAEDNAITLKCIKIPAGGEVHFAKSKNDSLSPSIKLTLPGSGAEVSFFVAGTKASSEDQDVTIEITKDDSGTVLYKVTVMVRVRKNANALTVAERDRFLAAYLKLNQSTTTPSYKDFLDMHNEAADSEIHTIGSPRYSFLPWHRAYILDLERQLQKFDPSVSLPYWKFDEPAPKVFILDFMGVASETGTLLFSASNPLFYWAVNGSRGLIRKPYANQATSAANIPGQRPISPDSQTVAIGQDFSDFRILENNPHGYAHVSFQPPAPITNPSTAPQDPLFYMLHCNVDRIWALWQKINNQYDIHNTSTYPLQGSFAPNSNNHNAGDFLDDTMWPWNGVTTGTRPPTAPGGSFPQIPLASPSAQPKLWEVIDYQGYSDASSGADYDSIPYSNIHTEGHFALVHAELKKQIANNLSIRKLFSQEIKQSVMTNMGILDDPSPIDPTDSEVVQKLLDYILNKANNKNLRLRAIQKITDGLFDNEKAVALLMPLMNDDSEPVDIQRGILHSLLAIRFSSPALRVLLPQFKLFLKQLLSSKDPNLVQTAIETLSSYHDPDVQAILMEGLLDSTKALVPTAKAIQLLRIDPKANFYPLVRKILSTTTDPDIQIEAVNALSSDPESKPLIKKLLQDKSARRDSRINSMAALNQLDPKNTTPILQDIIFDKGEHAEVKAASISALAQHHAQDLFQPDQQLIGTLETLSGSAHEQVKNSSIRFLNQIKADKDQ